MSCTSNHDRVIEKSFNQGILEDIGKSMKVEDITRAGGIINKANTAMNLERMNAIRGLYFI